MGRPRYHDMAPRLRGGALGGDWIWPYVLENHNHVYIIIKLEIKQPTSLPFPPPLPFELPFSLSIGYEPGPAIQ